MLNGWTAQRGSTWVMVLAVVGGISLILVAGFAIGFAVLNVSGGGGTTTNAAPNAAPTMDGPSTLTIIESPPVESSSAQSTATQTITVSPQVEAPDWPVGYWSSGSPCVISYPGVELGREFGYTNDATIKSWVLGVQELIQRLYSRGWTSQTPGPIDGEYGAKTEAGVRGFQEYYGIPVVGRVGPTTWATLRNQCERFR